MTIFWLAVIVVGICIFLLCFNIIFLKKPFPESDIGRNKELRKRGIVCAKEDELKLWKKTKKNTSEGPSEDFCASCTEDCSARDLIKEKKI